MPLLGGSRVQIAGPTAAFATLIAGILLIIMGILRFGSLMIGLIPEMNERVFTIGDLYTIPSGLPKVDFAGMEINLDKIVAVLPNAYDCRYTVYGCV